MTDPAQLAESVLPPLTPKPGNRLGLLGLIFGAFGFLIAFAAPVAFLAWPFTLTGAILSIIGWTRKNRKKGTSIAGVIVSTVGFILSIITFSIFAVANYSSAPAAATTTTQTQTTAPSAAPTTSATAAPTPTPPTDPYASYSPLSPHDFLLLVKDPAAYKGNKYIIYGTVTQFDAATGTCAFLAYTSTAYSSDSSAYDQNTYLTSGDGKNSCPVLANTVQGDNIEIWVIGEGAYSYDTQAGGNTTVPEFKVTRLITN
jgi:hypothetical protein